MANIQINEPELPLIASGKVREIYKVSDESLLFVASDRISAFDVILSSLIPDKGKILTQLSNFWFKKLSTVLPNHVIATDLTLMPVKVQAYKDTLEGRAILVKKLKVLPIEAIVRGYLSGSGWNEYKEKGSVHGISMPPGLVESQKLPEPLFTPSTKAPAGQKDENIHPDKVAELIGAELSAKVSAAAIKMYNIAAEYALTRGIIIADTKFEFGVDENNQLFLIDEALTPDSSRFWPEDTYIVGKSQVSLDKQYVRDYLNQIKFDKHSSIALPEEVIKLTREKYLQVYKILTGENPKL